MGNGYDFCPFLFPSSGYYHHPPSSSSSSLSLSSSDNYSSSSQSSSSKNSPLLSSPALSLESSQASSSFVLPYAVGDHVGKFCLAPHVPLTVSHEFSLDDTAKILQGNTSERKRKFSDNASSLKRILKMLKYDWLYKLSSVKQNSNSSYILPLLVLGDTSQDGEQELQSHPTTNYVASETNMSTNAIMGSTNDFSNNSFEEVGIIFSLPNIDAHSLRIRKAKAGWCKLRAAFKWASLRWTSIHAHMLTIQKYEELVEFWLS